MCWIIAGPTMWAMTAAVAAIAAAAVFFLTNPLAAATSAGERVGNLLPGETGSDVSGMEIRIIGCDLAGKDQTITVEWKNGTRQDTTFGEPFALYRWEEGWVSCRRPDRGAGVYLHRSAGGGRGKPGSTPMRYPLISDLSRAGKYRLETDFFFDKDIPIEEKDTRRIWVEFELVNGREATIQGVTLRITGLGDKGLETQWINRSGREFAFGEAFRITRWEAGAWVDCLKPGTEAYFNSIAWLVPDGGEADKTYSLEYWDVSRPGTYRLETEDHAGGPFRVEFQVPLSRRAMPARPGLSSRPRERSRFPMTARRLFMIRRQSAGGCISTPGIRLAGIRRCILTERAGRNGRNMENRA